MTVEEQKVKIADAVQSLRPEAKEFLESLKKDRIKTTKDNYGPVMAFLSNFKQPVLAQIFLAAMIYEGYPKDTAGAICRLMGWNSSL